MKKWRFFITSLALDQRVDFEEGDIGLPGGAAAVDPVCPSYLILNLNGVSIWVTVVNGQEHTRDPSKDARGRFLTSQRLEQSATYEMTMLVTDM